MEIVFWVNGRQWHYDFAAIKESEKKFAAKLVNREPILQSLSDAAERYQFLMKGKISKSLPGIQNTLLIQ